MDIVLPYLVQHGFVAQVEQHGRTLAIPASLLKGAGDSFYFSLALHRANHLLEIGFQCRPARNIPMVCFILKLPDGRFFVAEDKIAFDEILQLANVARPGVLLACAEQARGERQNGQV